MSSFSVHFDCCVFRGLLNRLSVFPVNRMVVVQVSVENIMTTDIELESFGFGWLSLEKRYTFLAGKSVSFETSPTETFSIYASSMRITFSTHIHCK